MFRTDEECHKMHWPMSVLLSSLNNSSNDIDLFKSSDCSLQDPFIILTQLTGLRRHKKKRDFFCILEKRVSYTSSLRFWQRRSQTFWRQGLRKVNERKTLPAERLVRETFGDCLSDNGNKIVTDILKASTKCLTLLQQ